MTSKSKTSKSESKAVTVLSDAERLGAVREAMESACKVFEKAASDSAAINEKRAGSYSLMVDAAIIAGGLPTFTDVYNGLKSDIADNVGGIARKLGCKPGKPGKDGKKPGYVVSGSMMNAVSTLKGAMEHKIALTDKAGIALSYGAIRSAKQAADALAQEAKETPLQTAQRKVRQAAAKIADGADALTLTEANDCYKILLNLVAVETGSHKGTHEPLKAAAEAISKAA